MGSLYRSEQMTLCQLVLQGDTAYDYVCELGEHGLVQFQDLNSDTNILQRRFSEQVRRCGEMERQLDYLVKEIKKDYTNTSMTDIQTDTAALQPNKIVEFERKIKNAEEELLHVNENIDAFKRAILELTELKHSLREVHGFFDVRRDDDSTDSTKNLIDDDSIWNQNITSHLLLAFVTGVILRDRLPTFERMLWRVSRGNALLHQFEIQEPLEDPTTGDLLYKSVIIILFPEKLKDKVNKVCEGFHASLYPCPDDPSERRELAMDVMTRIEDLKIVLRQTQSCREMLLASYAKDVQNWFVKVLKMKAIYHSLNSFNFDVTRNCFIAECWLPDRDIEAVQMALRRGMMHSNSSVPPVLNRIETRNEPPTYNKTNKFTNGFQILIDTYGIASYREVNPAPYTIITFPFLFAVMFGDIGHGMIMTLFAVAMVIKEKDLSSKKAKNEIWRILFGGRYVILLMGLFSMYTGVIYNDIFGKSINTFGSHWNVSVPRELMMNEKSVELDPKDTYTNTPYPVGLDPVWQVSANKIRFLNAYKMKISIIVGVFHMIFGIIMSVFNYNYFNRKVDIFTQFLPQIIFIFFVFLYLVLLIFIKWVTYGASNPVETGPGCAPSILITFINMVLFSPSEAVEPCSPWMYEGQEYVQYFLMIAAMMCVPWMLLAKPIAFMMNRKKIMQMAHDPEANKILRDSQKTDDHDDLTEMWIHQAIHTIEYVLGSVSHTASYLRLWALSLAHAQLSEVLWSMVISHGLKNHSHLGALVLFITFFSWAVFTVLILVCMEGLSAFLHTLRLHWVEFQSKFYAGAGFSFEPFSFKAILERST